MKFRRSGVLGLCFAGLTAVSGFLYYKTLAVNIEAQNQIVPDLRELKQLDAEWNVNILKSRIGINNNYDPVTTPLSYVRKLEERLGLALRMVRGGALEAALHKLQTTFSDKEELVEQFKSQNAVLQNSLRYFPTAIEEFKALLHASASEAPEQAYAFAPLEAKANGLLTDILRFNLMPDAELGGKIATAVGGLERANAHYPATLAEPLGMLAKHARTILRQRVVEDALMARIAAAPTVRDMDALSYAFEREFREMLNEKQRYRTYLFAYSGLLLVLLAYAAWRLTRSFREIERGNQRLQAANATLEQRVAKRTAELEQQSAQLAQLAIYDTLTGLINRGQLMIRLTHALQRAERRGWVVALMFIDLDGFKAVNDTYGHAVGDLVLKEVATRVQRHIRQEDSMARFGGDEFVILLDQVGAQEGVVRVAEAVLREIGDITQAGGHPVRISASIGIGSVQGVAGMAQSADALLSQADHAMYQAKQNGKACFRFSGNPAWGAQLV